MIYGLSFLPDCTGQGKNAQTYFMEALELCMLADIAGLQYVKMTEHFLHPYGGYCPSPLSFLSAVAAKTKQIRLLTGCILPAFHHPVQIAAETAMIDAISQGRLDVGFARAYLPYEFSALGVDINQSRNRFMATIKAVIELWTQENVCCNTPFFQFSEANSLPKCTQNPHPPIWGAAVNSRQSFAWLAENLFYLLVTPPMGDPKSLKEKIDLYREIFTQTALENTSEKTPKVLMSIPLIIAPTALEAKELGEKYLDHYLKVWRDAAHSLTTSSFLDYPHYDKVYYALKAQTPILMMNNKQALVGSVPYIIDSILEIQETFPLDGIIWQIDFGEQPLDISKRTLLFFLEEVLPYVNKSSVINSFSVRNSTLKG